MAEFRKDEVIAVPDIPYEDPAKQRAVMAKEVEHAIRNGRNGVKISLEGSQYQESTAYMGMDAISQAVLPYTQQVMAAVVAQSMPFGVAVNEVLTSIKNLRPTLGDSICLSLAAVTMKKALADMYPTISKEMAYAYVLFMYGSASDHEKCKQYIYVAVPELWDLAKSSYESEFFTYVLQMQIQPKFNFNDQQEVADLLTVLEVEDINIKVATFDFILRNIPRFKNKEQVELAMQEIIGYQKFMYGNLYDHVDIIFAQTIINAITHEPRFINMEEALPNEFGDELSSHARVMLLRAVMYDMCCEVAHYPAVGNEHFGQRLNTFKDTFITPDDEKLHYAMVDLLQYHLENADIFEYMLSFFDNSSLAVRISIVSKCNEFLEKKLSQDPVAIDELPSEKHGASLWRFAQAIAKYLDREFVQAYYASPDLPKKTIKHLQLIKNLIEKLYFNIVTLVPTEHEEPGLSQSMLQRYIEGYQRETITFDMLERLNKTYPDDFQRCLEMLTIKWTNKLQKLTLLYDLAIRMEISLSGVAVLILQNLFPKQ